MRTMTTIAVTFLVAWIFAMPMSWAQPHDDKERAELAKALKAVKTPLQQGVKANKGFRAVSVMPTLKDGHPMADVSLVKGTAWKTVPEKLD